MASRHWQISPILTYSKLKQGKTARLMQSNFLYDKKATSRRWRISPILTFSKLKQGKTARLIQSNFLYDKKGRKSLWRFSSFLIPFTYYLFSMYFTAASAATAPSAVAVEICLIDLVRQSPATKTPSVLVVQPSSAIK